MGADIVYGIITLKVHQQRLAPAKHHPVENFTFFGTPSFLAAFVNSCKRLPYKMLYNFVRTNL